MELAVDRILREGGPTSAQIGISEMEQGLLEAFKMHGDVTTVSESEA